MFFMKSDVLETHEGELVQVGLPAVIASGGRTRIRGYGSRIYPVPFLAELFLWEVMEVSNVTSY